MEFKEWDKRKKQLIIKYFQDNDLLLNMKQPIKDDEELETMMFCMINIHHLITNEKLRVLHLQKLIDILYAEYDKLGLCNPNIEQGENE